MYIWQGVELSLKNSAMVTRRGGSHFCLWLDPELLSLLYIKGLEMRHEIPVVLNYKAAF